MEAAGRYMPDTNARFASYASLWIRKRINEAVAQTGRIVRLPHNMEIELFHAKREKPTEETVETLQAPKAVRIDNPVSEEGGMLLGELILNTPSQTQIDMEFDDLKFKVTKLVDKLKPRDKEIILDYFGIDREYEMPTDQIAEKHNMTNVRVCQIVKSSLQTLKQLV
jgi:RNA polymerase primary sigma factor